MVGVPGDPRVKESRRRLEGGLACRTAAARRVRARGARPKQPVACAPSPLTGLQFARPVFAKATPRQAAGRGAMMFHLVECQMKLVIARASSAAL